MHLNRERLASTFTALCEIESPSRSEGNVAVYLKQEFMKLGAQSMTVDDSAVETGSDTGNLIIRFPGNGIEEEGVFFACHMDTVLPAAGVKVQRVGDVFTSRGDTILGADDKSGIAVLLELMTILKEKGIAHCPIELVFTTCEEIGLLGAKAMDTSLLQSRYGYALDSTKMRKVVKGAPAANRIQISILGKAAHSGSAPEAGINALAIAAAAISQITLGRIDELSTANIGLIEGGVATNIIPKCIKMAGEVRSHSTVLLEKHTKAIIATFQGAVDNWPECQNGSSDRPSIVAKVHEEFPAMSLDEDEPVLIRIKKASERLNRLADFDIAGGGSDANIFNGNGLRTAILPTGMAKVHTTEEQIDLQDMVMLTELLFSMVVQEESEMSGIISCP